MQSNIRSLIMPLGAAAGVAVCVIAVAFMVARTPVHAQESSASSDAAAVELQRQIDEHNKQISDLDKEIAQFEKQLTAVTKEKKTLQSSVTQLNLSINKTDTSIKQTQTVIGTTQLQIQQLAGSINEKERSIRSNKSSLAETISLLNEIDEQPFIAHILSSDGLSDIWADAESIMQLQGAVQGHIDVLADQKYQLDGLKESAEDKRLKLQKERDKLVSQKGSLSATKTAKNELLGQTKQKESEYQKLIAQKQAAKSAFESALGDLNAKLQYIVKQSDITPVGKGVLQWPVDKVRVTQKFGNTDFAKSGAYNGKGHNGIDLGMPVGTPLKAALTGTITGTGNTDAIKGCYSFGKWVLIKHGNGLSTLYAHLSQINVSSGQSVSTGDIIGYSGETGYATGPHLHFGVYVSSATQIMKLGDASNKKTACSGALMPIAPLSAYLNPLNYL